MEREDHNFKVHKRLLQSKYLLFFIFLSDGTEIMCLNCRKIQVRHLENKLSSSNTLKHWSGFTLRLLGSSLLGYWTPRPIWWPKYSWHYLVRRPDQPASWSPFNTASFAKGQDKSTMDQASSKTSEELQRRCRRDDIYLGRAVCPIARFTCATEMALKTLRCVFFPLVYDFCDGK